MEGLFSEGIFGISSLKLNKGVSENCSVSTENIFDGLIVSETAC